MGKKLRWRVLLIVLVVAGAIAGYVSMGYAHAKKEWTGPGAPTLKDALRKGIKLGLDLRGGIHLVLQVNTPDAVKAERDDAVETLRTETKDAGIGAVELPTDQSFSVVITPQTDQAKLDDDGQALPAGVDLQHGGRQVDLRPEGRRRSGRSRTTPSPRPSRRSATGSTSSACPSR